MANLVSVIIPVYNGGQYIEAALESVFAQTFRDFEVIVVDNGSTDNTLSLLEGFRDRISLLHETRRGPAVCRNRAVAAAQGSLIAFLDSDDLWLPDKLARQVQAMETLPAYGVVTTDVSWFNEKGTINDSLRTVYPIESGFVLEKLLFTNWVSTSAAMVRRDCLAKVGGFDEEPGIFGEDWLMWMQIAAVYPVHFLDEVLTRRRFHPSSLEHAEQEAQYLCVLRNLEKLRQRIPALTAKPHLIQEAGYRVCMKRGLRDLQALELHGARQKLRQALSYKRFAIRPWVWLLAASLPKPALSRLKQLSKKLRRKHPSENYSPAPAQNESRRLDG